MNNMFNENFSSIAYVNGSISGALNGWTLCAKLVLDEDCTPERDEAMDRKDIDAWERGEWFYVGIVVTASRLGVVLGSDSIWGLECNVPGKDNHWLNEVAEECAWGAIDQARAVLAQLYTELHQENACQERQICRVS